MNKMLLRLFALLLILSTAGNAQAQASWHYLPNNGLNNTAPWTRFEDVYFTDTLTGYAVTLAGKIFKTTDAGTNWTLKNDTTQIVSKFRSIEFLDDKLTGLAGSINYVPAQAGPVYLTTDSGHTWNNITSLIPDTPTLPANAKYADKAICGIAHLGNTFYAVGAWSSRVASFYKSTDKGQTWETHRIDTNLATCIIDVAFINADTGFITGGRNTNGVYGFNNYAAENNSVVLRTTDGGNTWAKVFSDSLIGGRIWKIQVISPTLLMGSIEPLYSDTVAMIKSTDGGNTWSVLGSGFNALVSYSHGTQGIGFATPMHGFIGGYYTGMYETNDGGLTWDTLAFGENCNRFFVIDSTHIYTGGVAVYFYGNDIPNGIAHASALTPTAEHKLYNVTPNPAHGTIRIDFDLAVKTYVVLDVVNTDGRRSWPIMQGLLEKGHHTYEWNSTNAPAGNYLIWLGTNEIPLVKKFTVIK